MLAAHYCPGLRTGHVTGLSKLLILTLLQLYCECVPVCIRRSMTGGDGFKSVPGDGYE